MMDQEPRPAAHGDETATHVPLLSVTVLNYNYAHYLPQCLDSILRQTFTDFELLLINDCSTDNSLEVIRPYLADPRVTLIDHEQNQGYIASLIEGSNRSRGTYLTVISADDFCVSDRAFETLIRMLERDEGISWAHSAYGIYDSDVSRGGQLLRHDDASYVLPGDEEYARLLLIKTYVAHSGTIIRASAYRAVGGYSPRTRYACDALMWFMLCGQGRSAYSADELYAYRKHGANMSYSPTGIRQSIVEHVASIDDTFPAMRRYPGVTPALYRRAIKRVLTINAESDIFSGHLRAGWYGMLCAARLHPVWTIFQARTPVLVLRTLVGARGFALLQYGVRYIKGRAKRQLALAS